MQRESSSRIAVLLLDTLRQLEREPDMPRDDPAIASLERYVVRLVGELDAIRSDDGRPSAKPALPASPSSKILEILRNTLVQMDQFSESHPEVGNLKGNLVRAIGELETAGISQSQSAALEPTNTENPSAAPAPSHPAGRCREGPPPVEAAVQRTPGQPVSAGKEKNRSRQPEVTGEGMAQRSNSGEAA